jgi:hypothetical protein
MSFICWVWGRKHLPIPYNWRGILAHLVFATAVIFLANQFRFENSGLNHLINVLVPIAYIGAIVVFEKKKLNIKII